MWAKASIFRIGPILSRPTVCHDAEVPRRVVDREALVGVAIAGGFGIGWAFWAATGLSGRAAAVVRVAGVVIGAGIVAGALVRHGAARPRSESGSMFRSRG
jgi:hypothetical protein